METVLDEAVLVAWAAGDERAFEIVFRRHRASVRELCRSLLRNDAEAEEAAQETFLKAWTAIARTRTDDLNLEAWLKTIARNVCLDSLRARRRRERPVALAPAPERGPEDIVAGGDPLVDIALGRLAPQHRAAVELRFLRDLSHVEMARVLSKSPGQIKALVHRARSRLHHEFLRLASTA